MPEDFGLDLTTIAETFAFYNERFGLPAASAGGVTTPFPSPRTGDLR